MLFLGRTFFFVCIFFLRSYLFLHFLLLFVISAWCVARSISVNVMQQRKEQVMTTAATSKKAIKVKERPTDQNGKPILGECSLIRRKDGSIIKTPKDGAMMRVSIVTPKKECLTGTIFMPRSIPDEHLPKVLTIHVDARADEQPEHNRYFYLENRS